MVFIKNGRIILEEDIITLSETRAIAKFGEDMLSVISPDDITGLRKNAFGCEALVSDRKAFSKKYPDVMLCNASIEDIIVFSGKKKGADTV